MDTVLSALDALSHEELDIIEKRAGQLKEIKGYFSSLDGHLEDEKQLPSNYSECRKSITVVSVSGNEDVCFRDGFPGRAWNVELSIAGIDLPVKLSYVQSQTKHTHTQYQSIMIGRKRYELGFGDFYGDYMNDDPLWDGTHVLLTLHSALNVDYDQTSKMIHMLFLPYSWYPYIEDKIENMKDILDCLEEDPLDL